MLGIFPNIILNLQTLFWKYKNPSNVPYDQTGIILCLVIFFPSFLWGDVQVHTLSRGKYEVTFSYESQVKAQSVHLSGSFNLWSKSTNPLRYDKQDGRWKTKLILPYGKFSYKFLVNNKVWLYDPENLLREADGFGGYNSYFTLQHPRKSLKNSKKGDGNILESAFFHRDSPPQNTEFFYQDQNSQGEAILRFRCQEGDVEKIWLCLLPKKKFPMRKIVTFNEYDYFEARIPLQKDFSYVFQIQDGIKTIYYTAKGVSKQAKNPFHFSSQKTGFFRTPKWVREAIFYQIFPDRFCNGNSKNNPPKISTWGDKPTFHSFFGGDLNGITQKIPYLKELGINSVYLNPIFIAPSCHKYDASDYMVIDPTFGGEKAFREMSKGFSKAKIRYVLDGVFNHSGTNFFAFQDILKNQEKSTYKNWYSIHKFPVKIVSPPPYEAWWGFAHHPEFNVQYKPAREYLMKVATHWIKEGASGWRLDVPNELPHDFWKEFRKTIKGTNKDAYIFGEIWEDGRPWLKGDEFDSVMNYPLRKLCVDFFALSRISPEDFQKKLALQRMQYPNSATEVLFNMLSNHDVPRFITLTKNNLGKTKLAVLFQFTYIGVPSIYYGEEINIKGGKDPANRKCFPWNEKKWNSRLLKFYKKIIQIRKKYPELNHGTMDDVFVDNEKKLLVFRRKWKEEKIYIILHNGPGEVNFSFSPLAKDKEISSWTDLWQGEKILWKEGKLSGKIVPYGALILKGM